MSYAGLGQIIPGATVGRDSSRSPTGGAVRVSARWAQRAANAGNRYNFRSAPLIAVDGKAGPITIASLATLSHQFSSDQPVTNDPPTSRITSTVIIPLQLEEALASKPFIADPPVSAATRRASTSGSSAASATEPVPGKPAPAPGEDIIIADEGSSGLLARYGIWPWAIGGAALVGVGTWFMMSGSTVRANRRRGRRTSVRRNYAYDHMSHFGSYDAGGKPKRNPAGNDLWVWDWVDGGWNSARASSKAEATRIAKQMGKPSPMRGGGMTVTLVPTNVRIAKPGETKHLASGWD